MKVLHIITGLNDGGAEASLYRLCNTDKLQQHSVISLMDLGKYGSLLEQSGISVVCLNMPRGRITIAGLFRLWHTIRNQKPDVVQTWMYHADLIGGVIAKLCGVKAIFWGIHHSNLTHGTVKNSTRVIAKICAFLSKFIPNLIISCSQKSVFIHQSLGYDKHKFRVIPNGYDLEQYSPNKTKALDLRTQWNISQNIPLIGMVARFDPQKDHRTLIKSLSFLKRSQKMFHCILVGSEMDVTNSDLLAWIKAEDVEENITLLGRRNDIPSVMNALDIHVLSSIGEAFPNVLAEAMACGTPCVTTDVGDAALIVGDTGWIVMPANALLLANELYVAINALREPESWSIRQQATRERILNNFSLDKMIKSYHATWHQIDHQKTLR